MEAEVSRAQRKASPLTLLLLDLDGFKQINDQHGHPAGDAVLRAFADHLKNATRGSDLAARLGGDEFMLLLPDCDLKQLQFILARLLPFRIEIGGESVGVTFSAGWREYQRGQKPAEFLEAADRALYENKRSSRQTVTTPATSSEPVPVH